MLFTKLYVIIVHNCIFSCIGGSVVEFSPATREARVQFPANATFFVNLYFLFQIETLIF